MKRIIKVRLEDFVLLLCAMVFQGGIVPAKFSSPATAVRKQVVGLLITARI